MRTSAQSYLIPVFLLLPLVLIMACPTIKLGSVGVLPGSASPKGFTLTVDIEVEETDDTEGEGKSEQSGKGLLAMSLPAGWKVTAARYKAPNESAVRALYTLPQAAGAVAERFPKEKGWWWAFGSNTTSIPKGKHTFQAEFDVLVPKRTKGGELGVLATVLNDELEDLPAPQRFKIHLKGKATSLTPIKDKGSHLPEKPAAPAGADEKGNAG